MITLLNRQRKLLTCSARCDREHMIMNAVNGKAFMEWRSGANGEEVCVQMRNLRLQVL